MKILVEANRRRVVYKSETLEHNEAKKGFYDPVKKVLFPDNIGLVLENVSFVPFDYDALKYLFIEGEFRENPAYQEPIAVTLKKIQDQIDILTISSLE